VQRRIVGPGARRPDRSDPGHDVSPAEAVRALIDLANLNGGPDNITVIVVRVVRPPDAVADDRTFRAPTASKKSFHPAIWVTIGVALLIALGLAINSNYIAALVGVVVASVAAIVGMVQSFGPVTAEQRAEVGPFGGGPHRSMECRPTRESVEDLATYTQKLREAATDQGWKVDWARFNSLAEAAQNASAAGQFGAAVRQTALAISFMMDQIRHQRPRPQSSDSAVVDL
jgi:protein phosphatase